MEKNKDIMIDDDEMPFDDLGAEAEDSPRIEEPEEEQNTITSLQELIAHGKKRGFVTEGEILQLVPNPETDVDKLEEIQKALAAAGLGTRDEMISGGSDVAGETVFDEDAEVMQTGEIHAVIELVLLKLQHRNVEIAVGQENAARARRLIRPARIKAVASDLPKAEGLLVKIYRLLRILERKTGRQSPVPIWNRFSHKNLLY